MLPYRGKGFKFVCGSHRSWRGREAENEREGVEDLVGLELERGEGVEEGGC